VKDADYSAGDVAFIRMMIAHHQAAVDSSQRQYHAAKAPAVKAWAHQIYVTQKSQIEHFKTWLRARGLPESGSPSSMGMGT